MMRILLIGPYSPPRGGVQAHLTALRQFLLDQNVHCEVVDLSPGRRTDNNGVYGPRNALDLTRLLATLPYDISHLHVGGNLSTRVAALGMLCGRIPRRKSILTFHSGGYPSSPEGRAVSPNSFRGRALQKFDRVIAVNEEIAAWFRKVGVPAERVRLILPYAMSSTPLATELPDALRSFIAQHEPLLISVGGLEAEYDLPLQIEVLGAVREKFPNAGLLLVGSGSLEVELRRRAAEKAYQNHIFFCGDVDRSLALRLISDSDLMLRTTLYDGDSIAVREAVHFGIPVIATDRAPRPEGVKVIPAQDLELLGAATIECLRNGSRRLPATDASDENLGAILALYKEVLGTGNHE